LIIRHFEFTLDKDEGSVESRLVVFGDLEFADNVKSTNGDLGCEIILRGEGEGEIINGWGERGSNGSVS